MSAKFLGLLSGLVFGAICVSANTAFASIPNESAQPSEQPRTTNPIESLLMKLSTRQELLIELQQVRKNYQVFETGNDQIGMGTQKRLAQIIHLRARQLGLSLDSDSTASLNSSSQLSENVDSYEEEPPVMAQPTPFPDPEALPTQEQADPLDSTSPSESANTAQGANFQCIQNGENDYATIAMTSEGPTDAMIEWTRTDFQASGFSPSNRCKEVTERLNAAANEYGNGKLSNLWLTSGLHNRLPVICFVRSTEAGCNAENILLTISPSSPNYKNPGRALAQLVNFSVSGTGEALQESTARQYVNLGQLVSSARKQQSQGNKARSKIVPSVQPSNNLKPRPRTIERGGRL